ncbi:MAG: hypothetical protein IPL58_12775 [Betaproteobacteria bacterium]|uniref:Uncharacterized protein n=1 Tax=Candidatus Proximibacter danicus TaxID=2954365 RepID=A0A9D7K1M9_9PROT|nr:hypothetical protein [Candidatus Proximibacter danicus]
MFSISGAIGTSAEASEKRSAKHHGRRCRPIQRPAGFGAQASGNATEHLRALCRPCGCQHRVVGVAVIRR